MMSLRALYFWRHEHVTASWLTSIASPAMPESSPLLGSQIEHSIGTTVLSRARGRVAAACENKAFHLTLVSLVNLARSSPAGLLSLL
jgi:hypothetical protein